MSRQTAEQDKQQIAIESVRRSGDRIAAVVSAIALIFSAYSLWESSLKSPDVRVFVPPVIHYAAPYQNSNFEMISIPVTFTNEGARTGTVLSIGLEVTDPKSNETKRYYAAELGRWTMERTRSGAYQQFAPLSLAGRSSRTEAVLFYTRGEEEKPNQLIRDVGSYTLKLTLDLAEVEEFAWLDRLWKATTPSVTFERSLRVYDARAFTNGTLPLYDKDWQASVSGN
jgi:hypothetical protein